MKNHTPDVFEEDFYDDVQNEPETIQQYEHKQFVKSQKIQEKSVEEPVFRTYEEVEKTFDLKYIGKKLYQKFIVRETVEELNTMVSEIKSVKEKWVLVPTEKEIKDDTKSDNG